MSEGESHEDLKKIPEPEKKKRKVPWRLKRDVDGGDQAGHGQEEAPSVENFAHRRVENLIAYVGDFQVRHKRKILQIMRQTCTHPAMFIPRFGLSAGELAIAHVLTDRQRKK